MALTPEVAGMWCDDYSKALLGAERNLGSVVHMTHAVLREEAWRERLIRTGEVVQCASFLEFLTAPPLKGLAEDPERIAALLRDEPDTLRLFREATTAPASLHRVKIDASDNITTTYQADQRGTARSYTLTRLHKARPDLYARVVAGDLSANQAAIAAGFRHKPTALEQAERAVAKLSADDLRALLQAILARLEVA